MKNPIVASYKGEALKKPETSTYQRKYFRYDGKSKKAILEPTDEEVTITLKPYIPDDDLIEAVKLTQILQRPLLIRGEPGSGKTRLAQAVAFEIYKDKEESFQDYYFEWHVKSTTKAVDGLYTFDHIGRLRDAQLAKQEEHVENASLTKYRSFGMLGKAFAVSSPETPAVVLIDEIDKADIDFPNDLLLELDQLRFTIPETSESVQAQYPPIIFITSNDEKELPAAFLRRCLFHYIEFPSRRKLSEIITANYPNLDKLEPEIIPRILNRFEQLRQDVKEDTNTSRPPSTSELLDWVKVINYHYEVEEAVENLDLDKAPPYHQAVLKSLNDIKRELNRENKPF